MLSQLQNHNINNLLMKPFRQNWKKECKYNYLVQILFFRLLSGSSTLKQKINNEDLKTLNPQLTKS